MYCPAGEILRQKCIKKNGNIRYANKNVSIVKTETSAIREKVNGKRLILQKIIWRSLVRNGLRQKEKNVMLQNIVQKGIMKK